MFGTIITNPEKLSEVDKERYHAWYCGLCKQLGDRFGSIGCATLTYDMTFVAILLSSLYGLLEEKGVRRCVPHPIKAHPYVCTAATDYAADMNLFLAYYQCLDDWHDDHSTVAHQKSKQIEPYLPGIREKHPRQCDDIEESLRRIGKMEAANELNPDLPANAFGELMGELFVWQADEYADTLFRMGAALGRFIYLLDAVNDLRADIKKQRYNPLVSQMDTDFIPILTMMMAECTEKFDKLPITQDREILLNILYSGVWQSYHKRKPGGTQPADG